MTGEGGHQRGGVGSAEAGDRVPAGRRRVAGDGRVGRSDWVVPNVSSAAPPRRLKLRRCGRLGVRRLCRWRRCHGRAATRRRSSDRCTLAYPGSTSGRRRTRRRRRGPIERRASECRTTSNARSGHAVHGPDPIAQEQPCQFTSGPLAAAPANSREAASQRSSAAGATTAASSLARRDFAGYWFACCRSGGRGGAYSWHLSPPGHAGSGVRRTGVSARARRTARNAGRLARQPCRDGTARNRGCLASEEAVQPASAGQRAVHPRGRWGAAETRSRSAVVLKRCIAGAACLPGQSGRALRGGGARLGRAGRTAGPRRAGGPRRGSRDRVRLRLRGIHPPLRAGCP